MQTKMQEQDTSSVPPPDESNHPTKTVAESQEFLSGFRLVACLSAITLVVFLMLLDASIITTAIPRITSDFHSLDDVGWYGTAYFLTNCACQPLTGKIYTYFSNKWTFLAFFTIFEIGSAICGAAQSSNMLIIGRAVAGMGGSGLFNGSFTILHACVKPEKQPPLLGILIVLSQLGMLSGPLIGGALTEHVSWRWCFYINLPCAAIAYPLLVFITIPDHDHTVQAHSQTLTHLLHRLDLLGFSIFAGASIQILLALNWGGTRFAWTSSTIIGLFCGSGVTLLVFIVWEARRGDEAMIPLSLIRRRIMWSSCLNNFFFGGCLFTTTYYLPLYFQAVRGASPTGSGVDLLPLMLSNMAAGITCGILIGRVGYYLPFGIIGGLFMTISAGLFTTFTPTTLTRNWIGYQILSGFGRGLAFQIPITAVQNNTPRELVSVATALVTLFLNLGGAVCLSLSQTVLNTELIRYLAVDAPSANAGAVVAAGATAFRNVVPANLLPQVIIAYNKAVVRVFALTAGLAGGALLFAFGMGWMNIKKKAETKKKEEEALAEAKTEDEASA